MRPSRALSTTPARASACRWRETTERSTSQHSATSPTRHARPHFMRQARSLTRVGSPSALKSAGSRSPSTGRRHEAAARGVAGVRARRADCLRSCTMMQVYPDASGGVGGPPVRRQVPWTRTQRARNAHATRALGSRTEAPKGTAPRSPRGRTASPSSRGPRTLRACPRRSSSSSSPSSPWPARSRSRESCISSDSARTRPSRRRSRPRSRRRPPSSRSRAEAAARRVSLRKRRNARGTPRCASGRPRSGGRRDDRRPRRW